jgi:hypothetical protein
MMKQTTLRLILLAAITSISIWAVQTANSEIKSGDACVPAPSSLVGWWPGEGNANDMVDGNHGTAGGGTTYETGKVGQAFSFDGSSGHINILDNGQGVPLDGFSQLTIDAWIKPDSIGWPDPESGGNISAIVSKHDTTKTNGVSYSLFQFNGKLRFAIVQTINPDNAVGILSDADIPIGTWSHVAAVWRGGADFELYLNGATMAGTLFSEGSIPTVMADNVTPVNIGRVESFSGTFTGPAAFFDGLIDEVDIFNSALSASTIQAIYNAGSSGKCDPEQIEKTFLPVVVNPNKPIFFDNFSNPSSGWAVEDQQGVRYSYRNNEYEILLRTNYAWTGASAPISDIDNYTVAADMRQHSGKYGGYGLIFERVDWEHFYLFLVFPDVQAYMLARNDSGWTTLIPVTFSPLINKGSATNNLEVKRIGNQIVLFINGTQLASTNDATYFGFFREVGLYAQSENTTPIDDAYCCKV